MTRLILLDSSVIFDVLNGKRGPERVSRSAPAARLSAGLLFREPDRGRCGTSRSGTNADRGLSVDEVLSALKFYPLTAEIAIRAGLLKREWRQKGLTRGDADVNLTAVAIHHQLGFVTDNGKHFPLSDSPLLPLPEWPGDTGFQRK